MPETRWSLVLHGGAKDIEPGEEEAHCRGLSRALATGREILLAGGSAVDAVERTVRALEDDPIFNAGTGAVKNADGEISLDASIMDGATLDIGAVVGLQVRNPVSIARALLREKPILLAGQGARDFARNLEAEMMVADREPRRMAVGCDTVGCVALDQRGDYAVATSTGGLDDTMPGRVGDVPMPGCGSYAENGRGALSLSGDGEAIGRLMLAGETLRLMDGNATAAAIATALLRLSRLDAEAGIIAIDRNGDIAWDHVSSHFAVAWAQSGNPSGGIALRRKDSARDR